MLTISSDVCIIALEFCKVLLTIGKDPDVGKDRGQEEKGVTEDEKTG